MSNPISILLIEDDIVDQMAFTALVESEKLPYQVQPQGPVAEARQLLTSCLFDLVITDYRLPDGTSFELFDILENRRRSSPQAQATRRRPRRPCTSECVTT